MQQAGFAARLLVVITGCCITAGADKSSGLAIKMLDITLFRKAGITVSKGKTTECVRRRKFADEWVSDKVKWALIFGGLCVRKMGYRYFLGLKV